MTFAQDSLNSGKNTAPVIQGTPPSTSQSRTPQRRQNRPRRLTAADSLKLAASRDSLQKLNAASGSAFNIGQPNASVNAPPRTNAPPAPVVDNVKVLQKSDNPFDIVSSNSESNVTDSASIEKKETSANPSMPSLLAPDLYAKNFLFWLFLIVLVFMALVVANARGAIQNAYAAILSDSALRQIYKEPIGWGNLAYLALYVLSWLSIAIFAFLLYNKYGTKLPYSKLTIFTFCFLGVSGLSLLRHAVLYIIANVFPIAKEVRTYNFIIMTAGLLMGLLLMPFNIFIAYAPADLSQLFVYGAFGVIGIAYLVRSLRGLTVATTFLMDNKFHFLLYLCTVEFAPLLVLIKLIMPYY